MQANKLLFRKSGIGRYILTYIWGSMSFQFPPFLSISSRLLIFFHIYVQLQKTSISFIDHLSDEYHEYVDIVQPVQVAIYEMKLGLSLVLSSIFEENFLNKIGEQSIDSVMVWSNSFLFLFFSLLLFFYFFSNYGEVIILFCQYFDGVIMFMSSILHI